MTNFYVFYLLSFIYRLSCRSLNWDWTLSCCGVLDHSWSCEPLHIPDPIDMHVVYCMQVCVPTLKTECVNDQVKDGLKLYQEEACYTVGFHHVLWCFSSGRYVLELDRYVKRSRAATAYCCIPSLVSMISFQSQKTNTQPLFNSKYPPMILLL